MPNMEKRARQLSYLYYNQGLERAEVRDLSGAQAKLQESLQLNKRNIQARNLLGLVYFETGEVVSALKEWLISQSLQSKDNLASEYLARLQHEQASFKAMNEGIRAYNKALRNCWDGNEDIAAIQLRRTVSRQPKLIRAAQLLALIDIREGKLGQAKRILLRAEQVDRTNPVTLRYLHEIEQQIQSSSRKKRAQKASEEAEAMQEETAASGRPRFRETTAFGTLVNILIGLGLGILAIGFLAVPAARRSVSESTNARIVDYSTTIAEQKDHISNLQSQIDESNAIVEQARQQVESTEAEFGSYQSLIKAYNYMQQQDYMKAGDEIAKIDATLLSDDTIEVYNSIHDSITVEAYDAYVHEGAEASYLQNWNDAVSYLEKAVAIQVEEDTLNLLGAACLNAGQDDKAIKYYQMILDYFPNSRSVDNAAYAITILGGTPSYDGTGAADTDAVIVYDEEDQDTY